MVWRGFVGIGVGEGSPGFNVVVGLLVDVRVGVTVTVDVFPNVGVGVGEPVAVAEVLSVGDADFVIAAVAVLFAAVDLGVGDAWLRIGAGVLTWLWSVGVAVGLKAMGGTTVIRSGSSIWGVRMSSGFHGGGVRISGRIASTVQAGTWW